MINKIQNDTREDVERSIMYFHRDKIIIRYMNITFKTSIRKNDGGIQALMSYENRIKKEDKYTKKLKKLYPMYCCKEKKGGIRISLTPKRSKKKIKYVNVLRKMK